MEVVLLERLHCLQCGTPMWSSCRTETLDCVRIVGIPSVSFRSTPMKDVQDTSNSSYTDADRPIESREQDRLGRWSFAEEIARQVCAVPADRGFTISLEGAWGTGKTSVMNMIAETLENSRADLTVLRFNPWLFGNADDLVARFFHELSAQLGLIRAEKLKDVAKAMARLGHLLAPLSPLWGTTWFAKLLSEIANRWPKPRSLHDTRIHLSEVLRASDARIVVLIDDLDRLEPRETRELMRLVRLISDLPNIIFLLAFDSRYVSRSLRVDESEGRQYLDKIIQMRYDIPVVQEAALPRLLLPWLDEVIRGRNLMQLDGVAWGRVFHEIMKPLFHNLRDVKRYLYSLPVTLDTIGEEVALADLLGLEAIRVLRPSLFAELRSHGDCLVHSASASLPWKPQEIQNKEYQERLSAMIEHAGDEREVLNAVMEILFPVTQGFLGHGWYGETWVAEWRKQRRVACEEVLHVYFQAGIAEGEVSSSNVQELVGALSDEERLRRLLDTLDNQRFERILERLEDFEEEFPVEAVPIAVPALVNRMKRLSPHNAGMLSFSPRFKVTRVAYRLLRRIEAPNDLMSSMNAMVHKVETLSGWFQLLEMVGHRESVGHKLVDADQAGLLESQFVERLESASTEQLVGEWNLFAMLLRTLKRLQCEQRHELALKLQAHLADDHFVLALLRTAVNYAHTNGHTEQRIFWDELVEMFGEEITRAAQRLGRAFLEPGLSKEDQDTINLAQRYASGWRPRAWYEH